MGKTYLWRALISHLRSENKFVLVVASSGIASLLLPDGRTAHSKFKIPIDIIRSTDLIIWDEAPMTIHYAFDAVDRTLRDVSTESKKSTSKV